MNNIQKMMQPYKKWEQYNKQQDVGLLTLFHQEGLHSSNQQGISNNCDIRFSPLRNRGHKRKEQNDHLNRIITTKPKSLKISQIFVQAPKQINVKFMPIRQRQRLSCTKGRNSVVSQSKNLKKSAYLAYYDVAQMNDVLNSRPTKAKQHLHQRIKTDINEYINERDRLQLKFLQEKATQQPIYQEANLSLKRACVSNPKKPSENRHLKSVSPQIVLDRNHNRGTFKLINLEMMKLRRNNKNFCKILKKQLRDFSQRYHHSMQKKKNSSQNNSERNNFSIMPPSLKLSANDGQVFESRTLSNSKQINQDYLQQICGLYSTNSYQSKINNANVF